MLSIELLKRLPAKWEAVRSGGFRVENAGRMVKNSTIGLIGLGNIGQATARRLQGFECRMLAYDPYQKPEVAASVGVELVDKETLLRESDVISIMVTLTDETKHLIGEADFNLMKPGAYLINLARGGVIDSLDTIDTLLRNGHLRGAALDVFEQEPPPANYALLNHPNVIATPHLGASTEEAQARVALQIAEQTRDFFLKNEIRNGINIRDLNLG